MPSKSRVATVRIEIEWDERWKRWVITSSHNGTAKHPIVKHRNVNTTAEVDLAAMVMLSSAVAREMESWLAA